VDGQPVRLEAGDLILFPHGDQHRMSSAPGLRAKIVDPSIFFTAKAAELPLTLRVTDRGLTTRVEEGKAGGTRLVCGFLGCDARPVNPLLASMPRVLHIPGLVRRSPWMAGFLDSVVEESRHQRPGGEAVLERMSEALFVESLRCYVRSLPAEQSGWLAATRDPSVGRALSLMHERPAEPWTLERLGEASALSRSTLHERFLHFIGQPPMQYLAQWRMQLAARRLRDSDAKVANVALEVGYENETAFARAFRRAVGESPGAWRRARRVRPNGRAAAQEGATALP
jgi:AraC-like DNA-binding protein